MPIRNPDPGGWLPDEPGGIGTTEPASPGDYLTYSFLGYDAAGLDVYRGSDGNLYRGDPNGPNGFSPYSGSEAGLSPNPPAQGAGGPEAPTTPTYTAPAPTGEPIAGGGFPTYTPPPTPGFTPPEYTPPPAFSYADFLAPTANDVLSDPGYKFRLDQGAQALTNNRAARGVLNSGGTLKDFLGYNQNFATQEYGNVWDRAANQYRMNRDNALTNYNTNYGTQYRDPYELSYQSALDQFAPQMESWRANVAGQSHAADQDLYYKWLVANA